MKNSFSSSNFFLSDHFSQIEDDNGLLNFPKFEAYLRELLQVGEDCTLIKLSVNQIPTKMLQKCIKSIVWMRVVPTLYNCTCISSCFSVSIDKYREV